MSGRLIMTAKVADTERCLAVLTLAFGSDPAARWTWPDQRQYLEAFPRFALAFGGAAIGLGTAHYYEGFAGVALWLPPGAVPDEESLMNVFQETVDGYRRDTVYSVMEQMETYHPTEPHWHLPLIGVDPAMQGRGIGSVLQRHVLDICDREETLAYLEATSARSVRLYERLGFEPLGTIQAGDSPPIVPMLRRPR
ncbi:MAG: GNAT family N-acetyltransferase [Thermodesulfobacteriota bacterium]